MSEIRTAFCNKCGWAGEVSGGLDSIPHKRRDGSDCPYTGCYIPERQLEERSDTASPEAQSQPDTNIQELIETAEVICQKIEDECPMYWKTLSEVNSNLRSALLKIKGGA